MGNKVGKVISIYTISDIGCRFTMFGWRFS